MTSDKPIIFFDGVCNLCNASVDFVIVRDKNDYFRFASLQEETAKSVLPTDMTQNLESIVLYDRGKIYRRSSAAIRIALKLGALWPLMGVFLIIPPFIRDLVYNFIARNRYKIWGKKDSCRLPSPAERAKFLP